MLIGTLTIQRKYSLRRYVLFWFHEWFSLFQVNENGLLSFLTEIPSFFNIEFPLDYPIIAALYSDVDCRSTGTVWHRVSASQDLLDRSTKDVAKYFPKLSKRFRAEEVIVVTWEKVGYFENKSDRVKNIFIDVYMLTFR